MSDSDKPRFTATVHFVGASPETIRAGFQAVQDGMDECGLGRIEKVSVADTAKRHRTAFDRSIDVLLEMHRNLTIPHPMTWSLAPERPDGGDVDLGAINAAVAVTTDPEDAKLLTALTQIVWSKTLARERLRQLAVAYIDGDDPSKVLQTLGPDPDPGLDLDVVQSFFLAHFGPQPILGEQG